MKAIIILMSLLGLLAFGFVVMTATPNDKEEYEKYMQYKERQKRHGKMIDADVLKANINTAFWSEIGKIIDSAPTIDAVIVVRCKECRYWEMRNSPRGWCVVHQGYVSPQYFCADGERKE